MGQDPIVQEMTGRQDRPDRTVLLASGMTDLQDRPDRTVPLVNGMTGHPGRLEMTDLQDRLVRKDPGAIVRHAGTFKTGQEILVLTSGAAFKSAALFKTIGPERPKAFSLW
jgi:hypothetical protein